MAEWLGRGLQNLVHRFESGRRLRITKEPLLAGRGFLLIMCANQVPMNKFLEQGAYYEVAVSKTQVKSQTVP